MKKALIVALALALTACGGGGGGSDGAGEYTTAPPVSCYDVGNGPVC